MRTHRWNAKGPALPSRVLWSVAAVPLLFLGWWVSEEMGMKTLGVVIYVDEPLASYGGVVNVMTRELPAAEFREKYAAHFEDPERLPGAPEARIQWSAVVDGKVSFVYIELPDTSYTYRFRRLPDEAGRAEELLEKALSVGGVSVDSEGNRTDYGEWRLNRAHYIHGNRMDEARARGYTYSLSRFDKDEANCRSSSPVRVCEPTEEQYETIEQYLANANQREVSDPWER